MSCRLFTPHLLDRGVTLSFEGGQAHYLAHVLRLEVSDSLKVFNGDSGEWCADVVRKSKRTVDVCVQRCLRPPSARSSERVLLFAPLRPQRLEWLVEKATELGVTHFVPCQTDHTAVRDVNWGRLERIAIEATEQSNQLHPPLFLLPAPLKTQLESWSCGDPLHRSSCNNTSMHSTSMFFCDIDAEVSLPQKFLQQSFSKQILGRPLGRKQRFGVIIGPEGGWSMQEKDLLREEFPQIPSVRLGHTILRAETAAVVASGVLTGMIDGMVDATAGGAADATTDGGG